MSMRTDRWHGVLGCVIATVVVSPTASIASSVPYEFVTPIFGLATAPDGSRGGLSSGAWRRAGDRAAMTTRIATPADVP